MYPIYIFYPVHATKKHYTHLPCSFPFEPSIKLAYNNNLLSPSLPPKKKCPLSVSSQAITIPLAHSPSPIVQFISAAGLGRFFVAVFATSRVATGRRVAALLLTKRSHFVQFPHSGLIFRAKARVIRSSIVIIRRSNARAIISFDRRRS